MLNLFAIVLILAVNHASEKVDIARDSDILDENLGWLGIPKAVPGELESERKSEHRKHIPEDRNVEYRIIQALLKLNFDRDAPESEDLLPQDVQIGRTFEIDMSS